MADLVIEGIKYTLNDDLTATVIGLDNSSFTGTVTIPETIKYYGNTYQITQIGERAFYEYKFKVVNIGNSVTSIGKDAFYDCSSLTSVTISNSVTSIGSYAFSRCSGLTSVTIPNSVTSIGYEAFRNCTGLTSVTIGNSVTSIGESAFSGCSGLTSVTIGNSVTSIEEAAFSGCSGLISVTINSNAIISKDYSSDSNMSHIFGRQVKSYTIGNSVTSIGQYAFWECSGLTSVTIGNAVTSIGYAFNGCSGLTEINVDENNTAYSSIDGVLFNKSQTELILYPRRKQGTYTIPNSVTYIGRYAFSGCSGLTSVTIPNSVTSIGSYAFSGCSGLTSVTIPNSVTSIGSSAFSNCSGLTSVTIPNSVTSIGDYAFSRCSGLTSVTINSNVIMSKGYSHQSNMSHIFGSQVKNYTIGDGVTSIGKDAFYDCSSLTSVTIGNSVTSIGEKAFDDCTGLTSVTIGNAVTSIGYAFNGCSGLTEINVDENNTAYSSIDGVLFNKSQTELILYPRRKQGTYTIPNSVTYIGRYAFSGCSGLTSVTIPNSVTSIGSYAFSGCSGLTSVTIPNSVTYIGSEAFSGCRGLTSVTIPNSVTNIGSEAFSGCSGLTSIDIPNSVMYIGSEAFSGCNLKKVIWFPLKPPIGYWDVSAIIHYVPNDSYTSLSNKTVYPNLASMFEVDGIKYVPVNPSARSCDAIDCVYSASVENIKIGNTVIYRGIAMIVKDVNPYLCCANRYIKKVEVENNGSIGKDAFYDCSSLTSVTIGNSVTSIGSSAFSRCTGLTEINVDENNTACSSIDGILFNKSRTKLVKYPIGKQGTYTIPNSVTSIGSDAFEGCRGLTSVTIPNSVTRIGGSAFYYCTGLTSIDIPNSVTSIGIQAFSSCTGLTSVTIPNSVTSIGGSAFWNCSGLTDIYCHIEEPLTIDSYVFNNVPKNTCTLHVPIGSKAKYKAANYCKDFLNIVEDLPTGIVSIDNSQSTIDNDVWFTLNGVRLNGKPTIPGIYIVNGLKVVIK